MNSSFVTIKNNEPQNKPFSPAGIAQHQYSHLRFEAAVDVVWHKQQHAELLQGNELHIPLIALSHLQPLQQCVRVHVRHDAPLPYPPNTQSPCQQQEKNEQGQSLVLLMSHQVVTFIRNRRKKTKQKKLMSMEMTSGIYSNRRRERHTKSSAILLWALTSTFSHLFCMSFGSELKTQPLSNWMKTVG